MLSRHQKMRKESAMICPGCVQTNERLLGALSALCSTPSPRCSNNIKMIGADRWALRMLNGPSPISPFGKNFCGRIVNGGCPSCAPLLALSDMSSPGEQRHLCLAGPKTRRSRTIGEESFALQQYPRVRHPRCAFCCSHSCQLPSLRPAQQSQTPEKLHTHPTRPCARPRTAADALIYHQYPDLEQPQVPAVSRTANTICSRASVLLDYCLPSATPSNHICTR